MEDVPFMKGEPQKPAIRVSEETKDRIANFGKAGESLETALIRVLDKAEKFDALQAENEALRIELAGCQKKLKEHDEKQKAKL